MFMLLSNDVKQPIIEELESKILTDEFMNNLLINLTAHQPHSAFVVPVLYDDSLSVDTDSLSRVQNDKPYLAVRVHYGYTDVSWKTIYITLMLVVTERSITRVQHRYLNILMIGRVHLTAEQTHIFLHQMCSNKRKLKQSKDTVWQIFKKLVTDFVKAIRTKWTETT